MDRLAFIIGETFIYWNAVVITLAAAAAICLFLGLYIGKTGNMMGGIVAVPLAIPFSVILARMIHWYCRADSYEGLKAALVNLSGGGYALIGVFAGCILAAVLVRLLRIIDNLPEMLDCMSIAGAGGIAVGRLACFFNTADRGQIIESVQELPWVYPVTNAVSGAIEHRLATFVLQAGVVGILFAVLLLFFLIGSLRRKLRSGDTTLLFLLAYGASQVVLDSTRYDSLFFRSNGFVSVVQVLSAVCIVLAIAVFSVRMVKAMGFRKWHIALWVLLAAMLGGAGYMEYHVQRHGNQALFAYTVMSSCLLGIVLETAVIRCLSIWGKPKIILPSSASVPEPCQASADTDSSTQTDAAEMPFGDLLTSIPDESVPEPEEEVPLDALLKILDEE